MTLKQSLEKINTDYFSADKKRDAARILKNVKGKDKALAQKYALMLERDAAFDDYKKKEFEAQRKRDEEQSKWEWEHRNDHQ